MLQIHNAPNNFWPVKVAFTLAHGSPSSLRPQHTLQPVVTPKPSRFQLCGRPSLRPSHFQLHARPNRRSSRFSCSSHSPRRRTSAAPKVRQDPLLPPRCRTPKPGRSRRSAGPSVEADPKARKSFDEVALHRQFQPKVACAAASRRPNRGSAGARVKPRLLPPLADSQEDKKPLPQLHRCSK